LPLALRDKRPPQLKEPSMLRRIFEHILEGDASAATECVAQALADGMDPTAILNQAMIAAMDEVGRRFEAGELYVPEMPAGRDSSPWRLKPPVLTDLEPLGKVVIGTVKGDCMISEEPCRRCPGRVRGNRPGTDVAPAKFVRPSEHEPMLIAMARSRRPWPACPQLLQRCGMACDRAR
jgi:hypothetical protein